MKRPPKKDMVWVEWVDAVGDSARGHIEDLATATCAINHNVGWILHENDERIILAHGFSSSGEFDYFAIPSANIRERDYMTSPRKKAKAKPKPKEGCDESRDSR